MCNHFFLENAEWVRKDWSILYIFLSFCWRLVLWLKKKGKGNGSNPIEPKKERGRNYNCNLLKSKESCEGRLWTDKLLARGITFTYSAYLAISVTFFFSVLHWDRRNPSALSFCLYFSEVGGYLGALALFWREDGLFYTCIHRWEYMLLDLSFV